MRHLLNLILWSGLNWTKVGLKFYLLPLASGQYTRLNWTKVGLKSADNDMDIGALSLNWTKVGLKLDIEWARNIINQV